MIKNFFNENNIDYLEGISLKKYNTYRLNTTCDYLVLPKDISELINILKEIKKNNLKYFILGNGSNIILSMENYNGIVIKLDKLNNITYHNNLVTVEAGYSLIKLSIETIEKELSGLEFASAIPGCVGASVAMNAGAYHSDISKILKEATILTPDYKIITMSNSMLEYSYRDSILKKNKDMIVLSATFELTKGDKNAMKIQVEERKSKRIASQPLNYPNAGSVFRNPDNMFAGEMIEKLNLKGFNQNGAEISEKHANFIINKGNATGQDIIAIINKIQKEVKENYKVELKLEQIIIE